MYKKATNRLQYIKNQNIDANTAAFIFEDAYETCRELISALMSIDGYKAEDHVDNILFLKKYKQSIFDKYELNELNRFRILRNDSMYGGIEIVESEAQKVREFAEKIYSKLNKFLHNLM